MALFDGTNAPLIKVYLDTGNRNQGKFILNYSLLGGTDTLGSYTPFSTLTQLPTNDVMKISIRRGRTREDQNFQPGQLVLTLDNTSGNYDPEYSLTATVTAASGSGTTVTYTASNSFKVGQIVSVSGLSVSGLNLKCQTITSASSTQFTVANSATGSVSGASGTARTGYVNSNNQTMLTSGSGIRVTATIGGFEYTLYTGYIEAMDKDLSLEPTVTITCVDGLSILAKMFSATNVNNLTDLDAIKKILSDNGWLMSLISNPAFNTYLGPVPRYTSALEQLTTIANNQLGYFFARKDGNLGWFDGSYTWNPANSRFTMTDDRSVANAIEYDTISVIGGEKYLYNTILATSNNASGGQVSFTKFNAVSAGRFGPVEKSVDFYFQGDADAELYAQKWADRFANPAYRVDNIEFECVGFSTTLWSDILDDNTDLGAVVVVKRTPIYRSELTYNCVVEEMNHDITPNSWRMSMTLSPIS